MEKIELIIAVKTPESNLLATKNLAGGLPNFIASENLNDLNAISIDGNSHDELLYKFLINAWTVFEYAYYKGSPQTEEAVLNNINKVKGFISELK